MTTPEERPQKIDKWDQNAVRLALDDAVKKVYLHTILVLTHGSCKN